jgi:hypothetical protein
MTLTPFLSGAICMGFLVISLYFVRFWKKTRDRLFLFFAAAFVLLLVESAVRSFAAMDTASAPGVYLIRLLAFVMLIAAIVDKNRRP